jgi:tetratricopeptide (TPR) repeat protein
MIDHQRSQWRERTTDLSADNPESAAPSASLDDPRVHQAMEEYLRLLQAGQRPDRQAFLARYPEVADPLAVCLQGLDFVHAAGAELSHPAAGSGSAAGGNDDAAVAPPEALGDFRIVREVGRGGMGVVYEAEQLSLGRRVALKVLPFAATMDPRQLQRFHNEARAAAALDHPHIVHVHAVGCERAVHYYAMQFIDGLTLAQLIAHQRGQLPQRPEEPTTDYTPPAADQPAAETAAAAADTTAQRPRDLPEFRRIAEWGRQAAEALDHAHTLGIVHRDIKPANLLVDGHGKLWVTDFGLAQIQSDARLTITGDLVGTLRYMSPEQALAKRVVVDHRTDVYSLGATLYELLTLEPAFRGNDRQELLRQIAFEEPVRPRRLNKAVPAELETIVLKALEKNPTDRYATAKELAEDLGRFLADEPIRARPAGVVRRLRKWGRRHPAWVAAAAALLLALLVLGGVVLWREHEQRVAAEYAVESALERAELLRQQERWDEALAVLAVAQAQLAGRGLGALGQRVEQSRRDVEMLGKLEEARLQRAAAGKEMGFDNAGADRLYAAAFAGYGLEVTALGHKDLAERIRSSVIGDHLIAALDDWAFVRDKLQPGDGGPLRSVADLVDEDPWRRRLRAAAGRGDRASLEGLAEEQGILGKPPAQLVLLARALREAGSWAVAERVLQAAQAARPSDFWINFELAYILQSKTLAKSAEALRFYQAALALRPHSPSVYNNLGNALHTKGDVGGAMTAYREALRLMKDHAEAHINLGATLREKGQLDEAIREYREAIRINKALPDAHCGLGVALKDKGQLDGAIAAYREAIRLKKDDPQAHTNLGNALQDKGDVEGALAEHREAIRLKKDFPDAHGNLGAALHHKGDLDGAIKAYREALRLKKDFPEAHRNLGIALAQKGNLVEATQEYQEALRLKKDFLEVYLNLGTLLCDQKKDYDGAIAAFREALRLKKDLPYAHFGLGNALRAKGDVDGAIAAYQEAIRLKKDYLGAHGNLGLALQDKGDMVGAIKEYREALRLKKDDLASHYNLGNALLQKGDVEGAIAAYREAIRLKKDFPKAHHNLGIALWQEGRLAEARVALRRAAELYAPSHPVDAELAGHYASSCERLLALEKSLPALREGKEQPKSNADRLVLAEDCNLKQLHAREAQFYAAAFTADAQAGRRPESSPPLRRRLCRRPGRLWRGEGRRQAH